MPRRREAKERTLKELYNLTERLSEPEITPVLKGSCRIQGPVDELDQELRTHTEVSPEKRFSKGSLNKSVHMRAESGTCNVCAAPCSSCMHFDRTVSVMESKIEDEFSNEICKGKEPPFKSRACDDRQHTTSEASNLCASSSPDSLSENAESKATMRIDETPDAFEDIEILTKLSPGRNLGEDQHTQLSTAAQSVITSHKSMLSGSSQRTSRQDDEHQGPECHADNISCFTGVKDTDVRITNPNGDSDRKNVSKGAVPTSSFVVEGFESSDQVQTSPSCLTDSRHETEESKKNSMRQNTSIKDTFHRKRSGLTSATAGVSECPSSKDVCVGSAMQKSQVPPHFQNKPSTHEVPKDMEENSGSQLQAEPLECSMEHLESPSAGQATITSCDELKRASALDSSTSYSNIEEGKENLPRSNSPSGALMKTHPCAETEIDTDGTEPQVKSIKQSNLNQHFDKACGSFEASDIRDTQLQSPISEGENSGSDMLEDDVKVCDICGDAGREEMLAICSRCSDGAEHTYCMRIMLDKVPDGDWLCEECQLKEDAERQKLDKTETALAEPKAPSLSEKNQKFNPKLLPKLETRAQEEEEDRKVITSPRVSTKRHAESLDGNSLSKKVAVETSSRLPGTSSPSKKSALSRESSFKCLNVGKTKPAHPVTSSGSFVNSYQEMTHSPSTSCPIPSKMLAQLQSPRGPLSRSATFNSNSKPKVKQLSEDFSQNKKLARESAGNVTRKDGLPRTIGKTMSFKGTGFSHSNSNESKAKLQSANLSYAVDPRGLKQAKEQMLIERKNSFRLDRPVVSSSPSAVTTVSIPKLDLKTSIHVESVPSHSSMNNSHDLKAAQQDGKRHTLSKPAILIATNGSEHASAHDGFEAKKNSLSHVPGTPNGMSSLEEQKSCRAGSKEEATTSSSWVVDKSFGKPDVHMADVLPTNRDGKTKDASTLSWSRQTVSSGSKNIKCHRCNEVGHDTQFCKSGRVPALKSPAVMSSKDVSNKSSKWKDVVEAAMFRTKRQKPDRLCDQSDELSTSSTDMSCGVTSKDQLSSSSVFVAKLPSSGGVFFGKEASRRSIADYSRTTTTVNVQQHSAHLLEPVCAPKEANLNALPTISDETKLKLSLNNLPFQASVLGKPLRISAIPEHDCIWQGSFEVQRSGRLATFYDGIQAHLSTCASPKVLQVVNKFPSTVQLEEAPRRTSWPMLGNCTTEENIALYFFARDLDSYEKNYNKLLENMLENDLALKGNLDGIELLIFPSNQLPEKSQRWNRLFFLWAVFTERRGCSESLADSREKLCGATLDMEPMEKDVLAPVTDKKSCRHDRLPKGGAVTSSSGDFPSSGPADENCYTKESSLDHRCLSSCELNHSGVADKHQPERHTSCSFPDTWPSVSASPQGSLPGSCSLLRMTSSDSQLCSEVKGDSALLKEVYRDPKGRNINELHARGQAATVQIDLNEGKAVPMYLDTNNCKQTSFTSYSPDKRRTSPDFSRIFCSSSLVREAGAEGGGDLENLDWGKEKLTSNQTVESDLHVEPTMKERSGTESRSRGKRLRPNASETTLEVSGKMLKESSQTAAWEEVECIEVDGANECKKIKLHNDLHVGSRPQVQMSGNGFSPMIQSLDPGILNKAQESDHAYNCTNPESSRTAEMFFFPVDREPISNCKSGHLATWLALESDDKDLPEPDTPNLELALGAEKKPSKQGIFPWYPESVAERNNQIKLPDPPVDDGNDDVSSLSLSLAFPFPGGKEQPAKLAPKTEQVLPEKRHVNKSLLLFGSFTGP